MSGYQGNYLVIDLSKKSHEVVPLRDDFYRKYLSGWGATTNEPTNEKLKELD